MKKKQVIIIFTIFLITIALAITCGETYARYKLTRRYDTTFSSYPFYFEVEDKSRIYALENQVVNLKIMNYVENQSNEFDTKYTITLEDNDIFTLEQPINGTITASEKEKIVNLNLKLKQNFIQGESITFVIKTTEPYTKEVKINVPVNKLGDYIKDLAESKKCVYNGVTNNTYSTDSFCNGDAGGIWDKPPYHTYLSGTKDCMDYNYVWYSGYMWRITEILNDGSVKMISENVLSAVNFGQTPYFKESYIKQWLNEDFLDTLYNYNEILETDTTWDISPWYDWCWHNAPMTDTATVGLLNPYELSKSVGGYSSDNFLNLGHSWWLSSYDYSGDDDPTNVSAVTNNGMYTAVPVPNSAFGVRPVVVLKANVKFSGTGTKSDPFVLLADIANAKPNEKINTRTPGELVTIDNMLYRIVNVHDQDGKKVTKLKSTEYIKDEEGNVMLKQFGSMQGMYTYEEIVKSKNEDYWGAYLNGSWLEKQDIKKYLVEDTYYVDKAQDATEYGSIIGSYKNTMCKEKNTKQTTKKCEKTDKTWTGYVGLPIVGELFAYPLGGEDVHDYLTATMTPYGEEVYPMVGAFEPGTQGIFQETYNQYFAVKPTITLKEDVIIKSGDGKTPQTAFEIELPNEKY